MQVAKARFDQGDFAKAAELLETAFELTPAPEILFNLARDQERAQLFERAIASFGRYLELSPKAADRKAVEANIRDLTARLEERRQLEALKQASLDAGVAAVVTVVEPSPPPAPADAGVALPIVAVEPREPVAPPRGARSAWPFVVGPAPFQCLAGTCTSKSAVDGGSDGGFTCPASALSCLDFRTPGVGRWRVVTDDAGIGSFDAGGGAFLASAGPNESYAMLEWRNEAPRVLEFDARLSADQGRPGVLLEIDDCPLTKPVLRWVNMGQRHELQLGRPVTFPTFAEVDADAVTHFVVTFPSAMDSGVVVTAGQGQATLPLACMRPTVRLGALVPTGSSARAQALVDNVVLLP